MKKHKPSPSNIFKNLRESPRLSKSKILVVVAGFAIIGSVFLLLSHAATPTASVEPETATITSPAITGSDTNASGGSYVQFKAAGSGGGGTNCGLNTVGTCVPAPVAPLTAGKHWTLPFDEEFSGTDYDHSHLSPCSDWNTGTGCSNSYDNGREHFDPGQIQVNGGIAHMVAQPHSPAISSGNCENGQCTYYSGELTTARKDQFQGNNYSFQFTYGYVEARLKVAGTQGFTSAFWMLPTTPDNSFNYQAEIDILEQFSGADRANTMNQTYLPTWPGDANRFVHQYHTWGGVCNGSYDGKGCNGTCPVIDYTTAYHTVGLDWEPGKIAFYLDGIKCGETTAYVWSQPMFIIMDLIVNHQFARSASIGEPLLDASLTREFDIDYLRVYQQQ